MKYDVYGRKIEVIKSGEQWKVYILGPEGKKRIAEDIFIPSIIKKEHIEDYLEDLLHEWATPGESKSYR